MRGGADSAPPPPPPPPGMNRVKIIAATLLTNVCFK